MTVPSIAAFRQHVRARLADRHVIVLGVDGIPYELACKAWRHARITRARSVFPTTSSTAWLTSLTGASVDAHGIPGVVFPVDGELVDIYTYRGPLDTPAENVFSDAARAGYTPLAVLGDLEGTHCTWRDQLVRHAQPVRGFELFARPASPAVLVARLQAAIAHALAQADRCFVWCFLDADRHIHHHGYDAALVEFLERIDALAETLSREHVVIAHSDHGLVPTRHDPSIAAALAATGCTMGGAGRTRWLYVEPGSEARVRDALARTLPASIRIAHADELFAPGSVARRRVGAIVLIAEGDDFLASDGYAYEHGSLTETELDVPVATWGTC